MSEEHRLDLEHDERTRVWCLMRDLIKADETLGRVLARIHAWDDGETISRADIAGSAMPLLILYPVMGPQSWYDPSSQAGYLQVNVRLAVNSPYVVDVLALWGAIERVFYPASQRARWDIEKLLKEAGAETGQPQFSQPANDNDPTNSPDGLYVAAGSMRITVLRQLDP